MKKGFTLVEMLIVIGIIAVLAGVMLTHFSSSTESAMQAKCFNNMRSLCNAVLADASKSGYYPSAGSYQYLNSDATKSWWQGWIGYDKSDHAVSPYHDASDVGDAQYYALTNGTIWRLIGGQRSAYVCPSHEKYCKRNAKSVVPAWSYVMNSYFGWDRANAVAADITAGRRSYGAGSLSFKYSSSPTTRKRAPEKVLLFAELAYADNGVVTPEISAGIEDSILQYPANGDEKVKANKSANGAAEAIGFNHKSGQNYIAHVAFADGHCQKLMLPPGANEDELTTITTILCTGLDYTFDGKNYEAVSE